MPTVESLKEDEDRLSRQLREVRELREKAEIAKREEECDHLKPLVIRAHDLLCQWNHTDGCGWGYEETNGVHSWSGSAHSRWLSHYQKLTNNADRFLRISPDELTSILNAIEAVKKSHPRAIQLIRHGLCP